ncbi:MAG: glutathione ABC transporter permease GsiD [Dehalococcoidia bacterium]
MAQNPAGTPATGFIPPSLADRPLLVRQWVWTWRFARSKPLPAACGVIIVLLFVMAVFAGQIAPESYDTFAPRERLLGASWDHWMGTDEQGRDIFSRVVYGARVSIFVGFGTILLSQTIAAIIGVSSGYFGGWIDTLGQRLVDIGQAFPGLVFIISLISIFGPGQTQIIISLGIVLAFGSSRVVRGAAISVRQNAFVEAAKATGAGHMRILIRHILPNVMPVIIVGATIQLGAAILIESSLSFLGYGVPPPFPSWGRMLNDARQWMINYPHMAIYPGLAIFLTVFAFNMLGDALRDVLDPRLRGSR